MDKVLQHHLKMMVYTDIAKITTWFSLFIFLSFSIVKPDYQLIPKIAFIIFIPSAFAYAKLVEYQKLSQDTIYELLQLNKYIEEEKIEDIIATRDELEYLAQNNGVVDLSTGSEESAMVNVMNTYTSAQQILINHPNIKNITKTTVRPKYLRFHNKYQHVINDIGSNYTQTVIQYNNQDMMKTDEN